MPRRLLGLLLLFVTLWGCGGDGDDSNRQLRVTIDWAEASSGPGAQGQSVRVQIFTSSGTLVDSILVNAEAVPSVLSFTLPSDGKYRFTQDLYAGSAGTGSLRGTASLVRDTSEFREVRTTIGQLPTSIAVSAFRTEVPNGQNEQVYVGGQVGDLLVPIRSGDLTYEAVGSAIGVSDTGLVSANAEGEASVRVRHNPTAITGTLPLTVTASSARRSKWTVLVFLNAANDLSSFDEANVNQMERVADNPDVRFVLQWKQARGSWDTSPSFEGTRRYLVRPDSTSNIASELVQNMGNSVDMGSASVLRDFIAWGKSNYPADRYCLVIWNHGNGWQRSSRKPPATRGVSYDDQTRNFIRTWELASALGSGRIDILSWDSSLMQMLEVAYEVKDQVDYVVGSQESPPGEGLPYDDVFRPFRDDPDQSTRQLTKAFVDAMVNYPPYVSREITQSSIETAKLDALANAVSTLGSALSTHRSAVLPFYADVRDGSQQYGTGLTYVDLVDFCTKLEAQSLPSAVRNGCEQVRLRVGEAVAWEGHNANSPGSNGIAIEMASASDFAGSLRNDYALLSFGIQTQWDEWLAESP